MTYNILMGAEHREREVTEVIARCGADVIALQEVTSLEFARSVADQIGMTMVVGAPSDADSPLHNVILTRLPVVNWHNYRHPGRMLRSHLAVELAVNESSVAPTVRVHCVHLAARVGEPSAAGMPRSREIDTVLSDIDAMDDLPHIVLGDFNALAPGDIFGATPFFRRMSELRRAGLLHRGVDGRWHPVVRRGSDDADLDERWRRVGLRPHMHISIPTLPTAALRLMRWAPSSHKLDVLLSRLIERRTVTQMLAKGYVDCFRRLHPRREGYTCATWAPASRIDSVFASSDIAPHLHDCDVLIPSAPTDQDAVAASDHWPLVAEFHF